MECVYCGEQYVERYNTNRFVCQKTACRLEQESDMLYLTVEEAKVYYSIQDEDEAKEYLRAKTGNPRFK